MNEDYAKVDSQLDGIDEAEEKVIQAAVNKYSPKNSVKSIGTKAANAGSRVLAGGLAAVQSASATSIAVILSAVLGISAAGSGDNFAIEYRDDVDPTNPYECLDEYAASYAGVFGTIDEQPLPINNASIMMKLKEINEWSKTYVAQTVPDKLVCTVEDCPYFGHEGCTDPTHAVERYDNGIYTYYNSDARIDLANVKRIHDFFSAYGLTDVQIAAICGVATVESRIDFTSVEGYNIQGERYDLDPSTATGEFAFKPWAEGLNGSPVQTATCIHEIINGGYTGSDSPIDYASYSADYPNIYKLGIGMVGFTDGPGFYNNTFLRNYADFLNDKVMTIQRLVEGSQGWREELRMRAADKYHDAYGASGSESRGTPQSYVAPVEELLFGERDDSTSSGYKYMVAIFNYIQKGKVLEKNVEKYNEMSKRYKALSDELLNTNWRWHNVSGRTDTSLRDSTVYDLDFVNYGLDEFKLHITDYNEHDTYYFDWHIPTPGDHWAEYMNPPYPYGNDMTNWLEEATPESMQRKYGLSIGTIRDAEHHYIEYPENPKLRAQNYIDGQYPWSEGKLNYDYLTDAKVFTVRDSCWECDGCPSHEHDYYDDEGYWMGSSLHGAALSECSVIKSKVAEADRLKAQMDMLLNIIKMKYEPEYNAARDNFNDASWTHIKNQVEFYNAVKDYYTACEFDMEAQIRDAAFSTTSIFNDTRFYTKAVFDYTFNETIDGKEIKFKDVFGEIRDSNYVYDPDSDTEPPPTVQQLRLYYELWQNYAKYDTNLPQNGKYINWWLPEVQLLFMVGGSYDAELGRGIKIRDEYRNGSCGLCSAQIPEYDTVGEYYYNWMSTWKGEDYTGRDLTSATKNFYYDMISGGFDNGSLQERTEYAYAYYYMFQYGTPYQQAINYANVNTEASRIMDEMIAEGRWQVNASNTLSDTAMPHNDKWKTYQTANITRDWEIDTSTSMSSSILSTLGKKQSHSKVNLLENIWNGCRYVSVIDNSTIGNAAIYLVDNPLIYADENDKFYKMKYGNSDNSATQPVSSLYKVVYETINRRLAANGKATLGNEDNMTDGFTFVKTCILWSGLDKEFENITNVEELKEYLEESVSSVWQDNEIYQEDSAHEQGRANTKIWEQRRLGPYYTVDGAVYYRYRWYLVPRVLDTDSNSSSASTDWYDGIRNDDAEKSFTETDGDYDDFNRHGVDEHNTDNAPNVLEGADANGYRRTASENGKMADWVRVDWECWDEECPTCGGRGGHGDVNSLAPGDIMICDDKVCIWLGEDTVQTMFPLEEKNTPALVYAGGDNAQKLKSMSDSTGFEWSKPCSSYVNHETTCVHDKFENLPTAPVEHDDDSCKPYNPDGKWTVYRLVVSNYTDDYRSAGVTYDPNSEDDWEIWYKYRYKGMEPSADTKLYLQEVRKEIDAVINTDYPRDERY